MKAFPLTSSTLIVRKLVLEVIDTKKGVEAICLGFPLSELVPLIWQFNEISSASTTLLINKVIIRQISLIAVAAFSSFQSLTFLAQFPAFEVEALAPAGHIFEMS